MNLPANATLSEIMLAEVAVFDAEHDRVKSCAKKQADLQQSQRTLSL
jgi:hypothetical protein